MRNQYFLWPNGQLLIKSFLRLPWSRPDKIENQFARIYPETTPVLFPSGRAAITAALLVLGCKRPDWVWMPPYSCHCLLESIARTATPSPVFDTHRTKAIIAFHQWGYVHRCDKPQPLIEDSSDSLVPTPAGLFPNDGRFEIFSLPKILGSAIGGLVLCRDEKDGQSVRALRDRWNGFGWMQLFLRTALRHNRVAATYWESSEAGNGVVPGLACEDISLRLRQWPQLILQRRTRLERFRTFLPTWLKVDANRLSSNIIVECSDDIETRVRNLGVTAGFRHFNPEQSVPGEKLLKVLPIPIHQDVPESVLDHIFEILSKAQQHSIPQAQRSHSIS